MRHENQTPEISATGTFTHLKEHIDMFICPHCCGRITVVDNGVACVQCNAFYGQQDGVPLLFYPKSPREKVTAHVKDFYEEITFPNYEDLETTESLIQKAERGVFARMLNEQLPRGAKVLEVGCGTGQMSNFLGIANRHVFGVDMSLNSLKLAQRFKTKNNLSRVGFYQMNLFNPIFKEESFDVVISNGVLHHTPDARLGFERISRLVKKDGFVLIGLYNTYGRLATDVRRSLFALFGRRLFFLDKYLHDKEVGGKKRETWFRDQYQNPHESKHTIGEVLEWFESCGFDFVYSIPSAKVSQPFNPRDSLFSSRSPGTTSDHFLAQLKLVFTGAAEGGFFIMIGKKRK